MFTLTALFTSATVGMSQSVGLLMLKAKHVQPVKDLKMDNV